MGSLRHPGMGGLGFGQGKNLVDDRLYQARRDQRPDLRQQGIPAFKAELPYAVVMVELDEGPLIFGSMPGVDVDTIEIGLPVEVYFVAADEDTGVPYWRPAS